MRIEKIMTDLIDNNEFFIIDDLGKWGANDMNNRINKLSTALLNFGVKPFDRVAIICENGSSFLVALFAVLRVNAIAALIDPQIPVSSSIKMIESIGAKIVCLSGIRPEKQYVNYMQYENTVTILSEKIGHWNVDTCTDVSNSQELLDTDKALILFSSGTTGTPKGVALTHQAVTENIDAIIDYMKPSGKDVFFITKTMVHTATLSGEILVALRVGASIAAQHPVVPPSTTLKRISTIKPTIVGVNPTILRLLTKTKAGDLDVSSVRLVYTSGSVIERELLVAAKKLFLQAHVLNVYGLTEAGPRVAAQTPECNLRKCGSVGKPIKGVLVTILNDSNVECNTGEIGSVYVKSPSLMTGYWNDKKSTDEKLQNGRLKTGDLGFIDEEGELFILGRADEVIVRGSHKIDPYKVENAVRSYPGIANCIIFGVPDEINGSRIVCAYVKEAGSLIDVKDIIASCSVLLASFELPQEIYEWESIPATNVGKVSRKLSFEYYMSSKQYKLNKRLL